jgi:hypothetical protein
MLHGDFDGNYYLQVDLIPSNENLDTITVRPVEAGSNPYFERFVVPMASLAGDPDVRVRFSFVHTGNSTRALTIDDLRVAEAPQVAPRALPADLWIPDDSIEYETGGWGVVEEPIGTPSL